MFQITVLCSGNGTNLQAIIDAISSGVISAKINGVISNRKDAYALERAGKSGLQPILLTYLKEKITRENYEKILLQAIRKLEPATDLIVLAGWMHILGKNFLDQLSIPVINLHPALPGMFPGTDAIKQAFEAYQEGEIHHTGCMMHYVVPEIDAGEVIAQTEIPIYPEDSYDDLKKRVQFMEKPTIIQAIMKMINQSQEKQRLMILEAEKKKQAEILARQSGISPEVMKAYDVRQGKVRDIWDIDYGLLALIHSNRLSSFDRYICDIPNKGKVLSLTSQWWFEQTSHIIPNHFVHANNNAMIVKKCQVIPIEVVVRAYITGSTQTSLWTHYSKGVRMYCGIPFPDGLIKNQKLDQVVITPTTKGEVDELIAVDEIIKRNICQRFEWDFIAKKSIELFNYASDLAAKKGYILVDTKLEFGKTPNGKIILIDEAFTCDSSRLWLAESYQQRFDAGLPQESIDKDIIREYVKKQCDPYKTKFLPEIPSDLIKKVEQTYINFYQKLTGKYIVSNNQVFQDEINNIPDFIADYYENIHSPQVVIISDSEHEKDHVNKIQTALNTHKISSIWNICSAHINPDRLLFILEKYQEEFEKEKRQMVFICVSSHSNTLGAIVACQITMPVISCPTFSSKEDYLINIHSSLQNSINVPVSVVLDPVNCALHVKHMFNLLV